jgi:hypothetical protein
MIGDRFPAGILMGFFSLRHRCVQTDAGVHPTSYPTDAKAPNSEVKRPGREAYHSLLSSTEFKNAWSYTSTPSIRLHNVVFV